MATMLTNKLCKACEDGNIIIVEQLLASGATPNFASSGNGYRYPLHYAADSGHVDIVNLLLQARLNLLNSCTVSYRTSTHYWLQALAVCAVGQFVSLLT